MNCEILVSSHVEKLLSLLLCKILLALEMVHITRGTAKRSEQHSYRNGISARIGQCCS